MFASSLLLAFLFAFGECQSIRIESGQRAAVDLSSNPRLFESDSLPVDRNSVASVGNGHVATTVYSDTVFMNGLYNGERGESHRARISSRINIRMTSSQTVTDQRFILDTETGTFIERAVIGGAVVEQRTFAHREITTLLITQIKVDFSQSGLNSLVLNLSNDPGSLSEDINFSATQNYPLGPGKEQSGLTIAPEDTKYQNGPSSVSVIFSNVPGNVTLTPTASIVTFIMSVASKYSDASDAYLNAIQLTASIGGQLELYQTHVDKWAKIWASGNILLYGPNLQLAKVVSGCMYYILSSLPNEPVNSKRTRFSGLSPGSLSNGALLKDYQGHSFWDTETWMYPPVLMLWPYVAKDMLLYRMSNINPARERATTTGYQGARFPWESGFTGIEVTPDCCPETRDNQQHITGDIAFAARQYWAATGDKNWLSGEQYNFQLDINGCDFIYEMAQFWASRAEFNANTNQYEINGVMPPDEDHSFVNNSVYTNVIAAYSIFFAKHAECECGQFMKGPIPDDWLNIARTIKIPFDAEKLYHPEFDGYQMGETIKQADVVLLGFPIMYVKDPVTRRNDLEIYENVTRADGPAMTWSMHAVGYLELGDESRAEALLNRSYQPYIVEPFKVWNEAQNHLGAYNFITGMGGFLQSILFGYAGFRLTVEKLTANPIMPPGITNFTVQGLDYLGCSFDIIISANKVDINWVNGGSCDELVVETTRLDSNGTSVKVSYSLSQLQSRSTSLARQPFTIRRRTPLTCSLPEDKPGGNR